MTPTVEESKPANSENFQTKNITSNFTVHIFHSEIMDTKIIYQTIKMQDSIFLYINNREQFKFTDLSLAMKDPYNVAPTGTRLVGDFTEEFSKGLACRLSKKLEKVVFLSCNIDEARRLMPLLEKRIYEEISNSPDKF